MIINNTLDKAARLAEQSSLSISLFDKDFGDYSISSRAGRISVELHFAQHPYKTLCSQKTSLSNDRILMLVNGFGYEPSVLKNIVENVVDHINIKINGIKKENAETLGVFNENNRND